MTERNMEKMEETGFGSSNGLQWVASVAWALVACLPACLPILVWQ